MAYNKTSYVDGITPLNARNLNNSENAIDQVTKDITSISSALVKVDDKANGKAPLIHRHTISDIENLEDFEAYDDTEVRGLIDTLDVETIKSTDYNGDVDVEIVPNVMTRLNEVEDTVGAFDSTKANKSYVDEELNKVNSQYENVTNVEIPKINSQLEAKANELEIKKADKFTTDNIQQQVNNLVINGTGDSNPEVVQARGEYSVVNDRLNVFDKKFYDVLEEQKNNISLTPIVDKRLSTSGILEVQSGYSSFEISVAANEIFYLTIYAYSINNPYLAFHDVNGNVLSMKKGTNTGWNLLENIKIIVPLNCSKIILSTSSTSSYISKTSLSKVQNYNVKNMDKIMNDVANLNNSVEDSYTNVTLNWNIGSMYNRNTGIMEVLSNCNCASIDVVAGEKYSVKTTGYGQANPYIILNASGSKISAYPDMLIPSNTTYDVTVTIPTGGAKLLINSRTNGVPLGVVGKKNGVLPSGMTEVKENITSNNKSLDFFRKNYEQAIIREQLKNDFAWNIFDKIYVTFTFDDSNADISDIETLFKSKNIPCCYATVPNRLDNTTNSGEKVREVLARAVNNGGEVLSHWYAPLTSASTEEEYYNVYVGAKKTLTEAGFDVNGFIVSGGTNYDTQDWIKGVSYARAYYRYADLVGKSQNIAQYNQTRKFLTTTDATNKGFIDTAISQGNQWISFASHGAIDGVTISLLTSLLDYIATKSNVKVVNFKYLFDNFGTTKLEKRLKALES